MTSAEFILGIVTLQRAGELVLSHFNTRRLLASGATEVAPGHYPLIVVVHAAWLVSLWVFGRDHPVNNVALVGYLILQAEGTFDVAGVFAGVFVLAAFVLVIDALVTKVERRLLVWRPVVADARP